LPVAGCYLQSPAGRSPADSAIVLRRAEGIKR
jgi:hypothetical protein